MDETKPLQRDPARILAWKVAGGLPWRGRLLPVQEIERLLVSEVDIGGESDAVCTIPAIRIAARTGKKLTLLSHWERRPIQALACLVARCLLAWGWTGELAVEPLDGSVRRVVRLAQDQAPDAAASSTAEGTQAGPRCS